MAHRFGAYLLPAGGLLLAGCNSPGQPPDQDALAAELAAITVAPVPYPANLDVGTWQPTDLGEVAAAVPLVLNLPAGAPLSGERPSGVYDRAVAITINDEVTLMAYSLAASSLQEAIAIEDGVLYCGAYVDVRKVVQEPNGFVYTLRKRPEADGTTYPVQSHFVYFIRSPRGAYYEVSDGGALHSTLTNPAHFPEAQARRLYAAVKQSAKVKE